MPIYSAKDVKYYKYIEGFQQPILTANGTMGGDSFAVSSDAVYSGKFEAWRAFNGIIDYEEGYAADNNDGTLYFYNPNPLKVKVLNIYNRGASPSFAAKTVTVYGSNTNNEEDWQLLTSYDNTNFSSYGFWSVPVNSPDYYKYYKLYFIGSSSPVDVSDIKIVAECLNPETFPETNSNWIQPFLTEDGTVGGDSYACRCNQTYESYYAKNAFDSDLNNQWVASQSNDPTVWIEFYSPVLLKVSQLDVTNVNSSYNTVWNRVEVFGSTDGETYFSFGEYDTNTAQNATWTVNIPEEKQQLTKYIKITGAPGSSMSRNDRCRLAFVKIFAKEAFAIESTKDDFDYYEMPKIKQIVNPKYIKYYLFNAKPWTQPQIPDNGTFGGNRFAVAGKLPYTCYNGSDYTNGVNENSHFEFYNPEPIKVNKITITSSAPQYAQRAGYVSYSDDNVTWTKSNDWTNPSNNPYEIPVTELFAHKYWQVYFTQRGTSGGNSDVNSVRIDAVTQNVQQSDKNNYDYREINQIKEVINPKYIKYYKYVYGDWEQPALTSDGTVGGDNYAARISSRSHGYAWEIFDKSDSYWEAGTKDLNQWVEFYSPVMLKLTSATFTNRDSGTYVQSYTVWRLSCSNDGINYDIIKDFDLGSSAANGVWNTDFNMTHGYKYFRFSAGAGADFSSTSSARPSFKEIELFGQQITGSVEVTKNDDYDYRELNQIKEVYTNSNNLVFTKEA